MTKISAIRLAAASTILACAAVPAMAEEYYLGASLKGAAEAPGPGDLKASSTADITLDTEKLRLCFNIESSGLDKVTMAHIHKGSAGTAGAPVATLKVDGRGNGKECMDIAKDVADSLAAKPDDYYLNIHNDAFPAGAVRGQLAAE